MGFFDYDAILVREPEGDYAQVDSAKVADLARVVKNRNSGAVAASIIVETGQCFLCGFTVSSVSAQYVQVFDSATLPAEGTVPTMAFTVAATNTLTIDWVQPRYFRNGIVLCNSSTQHTKTIGSADAIFDVQYV